jgi:hypothetical protein
MCKYPINQGNCNRGAWVNVGIFKETKSVKSTQIGEIPINQKYKKIAVKSTF